MDRYIKPTLFVIWLSIVSFAIYSFLKSGLSIGELIAEVRDRIHNYDPWTPIIYVLFYSLRSLVFFPASILTAASGLIFGPWLGVFLTIIGENISANISFLVGRYFGSGLVQRLAWGRKFMPFFERRFRENAFLSVLSMRLMYLPFDLVGYMSGCFGISHKHFALGSFLGTIPALTTFVLMGSAVNHYENLILAMSFLILGWAISRCLRERQRLNEVFSDGFLSLSRS